MHIDTQLAQIKENVCLTAVVIHRKQQLLLFRFACAKNLSDRRTSSSHGRFMKTSLIKTPPLTTGKMFAEEIRTENIRVPTRINSVRQSTSFHTRKHFCVFLSILSFPRKHVRGLEGENRDIVSDILHRCSFNEILSRRRWYPRGIGSWCLGRNTLCNSWRRIIVHGSPHDSHAPIQKNGGLLISAVYTFGRVCFDYL